MNMTNQEFSDFYQLSYQSSVGWINSADVKATSILTIASVILGLAFVGDKVTNESGLFIIVYVMFLLATILTVLSCIVTLWPRTNRSKLLEVSNTSNLSNIYFADVIEGDFAQFLERTNKLNSNDLQQDKIEQVFIAAKIANNKMYSIRIAVILLTLSLFLLTVLGLRSIF